MSSRSHVYTEGVLSGHQPEVYPMTLILTWNPLYSMYIGNNGLMYTSSEAQSLVNQGIARIKGGTHV